MRMIYERTKASARPWILIVALGLPTLLAGCTPVATSETPGEATAAANTTGESMVTERTLIVGPELVDCTGVAPMKCMQVKEKPEDDWTLFYDQIAGFTHEPGYEYVLLVSVAPVPGAPADASSLSYRLIEVVSKTPVTGESGTGSGAATEITLEGPVWLLASYGDPDNPTPVLPETEITAQFGAEAGKVTGSSGCNRYFGPYTVAGDSLTIGPLGSTMMACPDPQMQQEQAYQAALQAAETYTVSADTLDISGGGKMLRYTAQITDSLAGTTWTVTGYNNGKEAVTSVLADTHLTMEFGDTQISGQASCNTYTAEYTLEGDKITVSPAAVTQMMCIDPPGIMEQEAQFLAALQSAATYRMEGSTLELRTAAGALAISATAGMEPGKR